jgi:diaminohydroxyphosphoribosylaminopyrimidine deaminase / 5-amino-6-(5-phosphoribosylamino)uracil reductase
MLSPADRKHMMRAIQLSRRGFPAPNPHVGCVIVRSGLLGSKVVGEGFHAYAGGDHAEVAALKKAGSDARGATAYVTLEPCDHYGRTPPCSKALVEAGIARVVIACPDPNPDATGGAATLRSHGITVDFGMGEEAAKHNERFLSSMRLRRPYIVLKAAMTLDGRIALPDGSSKWITGELARKQAHKLRAEMGVVLAGRRTVELDDPELTARGVRGLRRQPLRVVIDPHARLTGRERVFDRQAPTLHVTLRDHLGSADGMDLQALMQYLFERGHTGLLVEGGAATIASFVRAGLWDRLEMFVAPKLFGQGTAWLGAIGVESVDASELLEFAEMRKLGGDLWITARPKTRDPS